MNRLKRASLAVALAAPFTLGACSANVAEVFAGQNLDADHSARLTSSLRAGRLGLEAYQRALDSGDSSRTNGGFLSDEHSNIDSFPGQNVPLGQPIVSGSDIVGTIDGHAGSASDEQRITPASDSESSTVTITSHSQNMRYKLSESLVLSNPDEAFFADANASPQEMEAFYINPSTSVVKVEYTNDDALNGLTHFTAKQRQGNLRVMLVETDLGHSGNFTGSSQDELLTAIKQDVLYEY